MDRALVTRGGRTAALTVEEQMLLLLQGGPLNISEARVATELNSLANLTRKGLARLTFGRYEITDAGEVQATRMLERWKPATPADSQEGATYMGRKRKEGTSEIRWDVLGGEGAKPRRSSLRSRPARRGPRRGPTAGISPADVRKLDRILADVVSSAGNLGNDGLERYAGRVMAWARKATKRVATG